MKAIAYAAALLGLVSIALGQTEDPGPSPTESVGCEPHGDHWHCEGPRETSGPVGVTTTITSTAAPGTTSSAAPGEDDHDDEHTDEHTNEHTDATGTGVLAPSPTESVGCEPHGDHWHCEGPATTPGSGSPTSAPTGGAETTSTEGPASTAAAPRYEVAGLGFAGIAAVAAMAL